MKQRLILTIVLYCFMISCHEYACADFAVVTNTSSLNLRSGPGYEHNIIGMAKKDDWVDIQYDLSGWDYVTVLNSQQSGYMADSFLKRGSAATASVGIVKNPGSSSFLNLREYPSYSAKVLGIYYNGAECKILNHETGWYMVEINDKIGYFKEEFLSISGGSPAIVYAANGKPVNVRSGPSMSYSVITNLPVGAVISVNLKGNGFWQIEYGGMTGYMSSLFIKDTGPKSSLDPIAPVTESYLIVANPNNAKVNLRIQPSMTSKVLAQYSNGSRLEVIDGGLTWCRVMDKATGLKGYIMTRYTTVYGLPGNPVKTVKNGKSYVNLRNVPGLANSKVLKKVNSGEIVTVLVPGEEWTQVRFGNQEGYMMTCFLK